MVPSAPVHPGYPRHVVPTSAATAIDLTAVLDRPEASTMRPFGPLPTTAQPMMPTSTRPLTGRTALVQTPP